MSREYILKLVYTFSLKMSSQLGNTRIIKEILLIANLTTKKYLEFCVIERCATVIFPDGIWNIYNLPCLGLGSKQWLFFEF